MLKRKKNKLVIISLVLIVSLMLFEKIDYYAHSYIVDNIYINNNNYLKVDYIGYIEIERLKIKREIVRGINASNLLNHVAMSEMTKSFETDNIILAGHAIKNIFGNLKYIKKGDKIKIKTIDKTYEFIVLEKEIVSKKNIDIIDNNKLILITCVDINKRLIVKAKRI